MREATKVVVGTHNLQTPVRFRAPQHVIGMKIYVLGSTSFMKEMVDATKELCMLGHDGWIHPHYEAFVRGEKLVHVARWQNGERAALKRENNYSDMDNLDKIIDFIQKNNFWPNINFYE